MMLFGGVVYSNGTQDYMPGGLVLLWRSARDKAAALEAVLPWRSVKDKIAGLDWKFYGVIAVMLSILLFCAVAWVSFLFYHKNDGNPFMRLMWTHGDTAMAPVRCALKFGFRCK